jgi:hypothetical protein
MLEFEQVPKILLHDVNKNIQLMHQDCFRKYKQNCGSFKHGLASLNSNNRLIV